MPLLEAIGSLVAGRAIGRVRESVRPNQYAPRLPDQAGVAADQAVTGLRAGAAGLAGSEAEWYDRQGQATVGWVRAVQDLTSRRIPPSYFELAQPGDPGQDPDDPTTLRDFYRGPLPSMVQWGENQQAGAPTYSSGRLNPPLASTPLPRDVVAARAAGAPQGAQDALDLAWAD